MKDYIIKLTNWLSDKKRILAVTHQKPDGDAVGSLFGFAHLLNGLKKTVHIHLETELPALYQKIPAIQNLRSKQFVDKQVDVSSYDGVVVLDAARADMPTIKNLVDIAKRHSVPLCAIDHHADNDLFADLNILEPYAATAEVIAEFALAEKLTITPDCATCLQLGIIRDTGGFRFQNTVPQTLRITAELMEHGADYHGLTQQIFFSEDLNKMKFTSYVINNKLQFACNNRVMYVVLEDEDFDSYGLKKKDMEGLIDSIRVVNGVKITCMITRWRNQIKLSMRSCDTRYPVNTIAKEIGGGGHVLAAGARMEADTFTPAINKFLKLTGEMFNG